MLRKFSRASIRTCVYIIIGFLLRRVLVQRQKTSPRTLGTSGGLGDGKRLWKTYGRLKELGHWPHIYLNCSQKEELVTRFLPTTPKSASSPPFLLP